MSLTKQQVLATKKELDSAMKLVNLTPQQLAQEMNTNLEIIEQSLKLQGPIENPWILKVILNEKALILGKQPISFSALKGNPQDYWFLDQERISQRKLDK